MPALLPFGISRKLLSALILALLGVTALLILYRPYDRKIQNQPRPSDIPVPADATQIRSLRFNIDNFESDYYLQLRSSQSPEAACTLWLTQWATHGFTVQDPLRLATPGELIYLGTSPLKEFMPSTRLRCWTVTLHRSADTAQLFATDTPQGTILELIFIHNL